jgi:hypothetical protein
MLRFLRLFVRFSGRTRAFSDAVVVRRLAEHGT